MTADAPSLAVTTASRGAASLLMPRGVLDSTTYRPLRDQIINLALEEPAAVVVDVTELDVPAESAWTVFTSARWHLGRWPGVPVVLACGHPAGRRAIARAGVTRQLPVYATVEAALSHVGDGGPGLARRRALAHLPATVSSLQRARELVVQWLTTWSCADMIPVAKVVATSLVENVLQHTDSQPDLRLEYDGSAVTVAVHDGSRALPGVRESPCAPIGPAGLRIVAALCRDCGTAPTPTGKTVWAVIGPENVLR